MHMDRSVQCMEFNNLSLQHTLWLEPCHVVSPSRVCLSSTSKAVLCRDPFSSQRGQRHSAVRGITSRKRFSKYCVRRCHPGSSIKDGKVPHTAEDVIITDENFMRLALENAKKAASLGEVPIGAVIVHNNKVISSAWNFMEGSGDPTSHAEMRAIQQAVQKIGRFKLLESTLYVTLEPCPMCAGAILQARLRRLVYAAKNPLLGADGSWISFLRSGEGTNFKPHPFHPKLHVCSGVLETDSNAMLKQFFKERRQQPSRKPINATPYINLQEDTT